MKEKFHNLKKEEARNAAIAQYRAEIDKIAELTDIDLAAEEQPLPLRDRITDIELALCELYDALLGE